MNPADEMKNKAESKVELNDEEIGSVTGGVGSSITNSNVNDESEDVGLVNVEDGKSTYTPKPRQTPSKSRFKR